MFSAGLDLVKEVYQPADVKRLASFWSCFQGMWLRLYGSRLATMAAINVGELPVPISCIIDLLYPYYLIVWYHVC